MASSGWRSGLHFWYLITHHYHVSSWPYHFRASCYICVFSGTFVPPLSLTSMKHLNQHTIIPISIHFTNLKQNPTWPQNTSRTKHKPYKLVALSQTSVLWHPRPYTSITKLYHIPTMKRNQKKLIYQQHRAGLLQQWQNVTMNQV